MRSSVFFVTLVMLVLNVNVASAADNDDKNDILRPGVAASSQRFSHAGAVDMSDTPVIDMSGGKKEGEALENLNPILGRVTRQRGSRCVAELKNNSMDDYSVRYQIISENRDGKVVGKESFSSSLPAQKMVSKSFLCQRDQNMRVVLISGKKKSKTGSQRQNPVAKAENAPVAAAPASNKASSDLKPFEPFTP